MTSDRQAEGRRWAMIRETRGMTRASSNQATKRGYRHRVPDVPRGTAVTTTQKCVPPHVKTREALPQARPMTGRARLESYGASSADQLTGAQRRRYRAKMFRQVNRTSGIARTLRGREVPKRVQLTRPPEPGNLVEAAEARSLLKRINEVWRRSR